MRVYFKFIFYCDYFENCEATSAVELYWTNGQTLLTHSVGGLCNCQTRNLLSSFSFFPTFLSLWETNGRHNL